MVLSAVSVLGVGLLGVGVALEIALLVALALATLLLVGLVNAITMLGRFLDAVDE
jgi:hypothetical protein